jgi:hypothetical protein
LCVCVGVFGLERLGGVWHWRRLVGVGAFALVCVEYLSIHLDLDVEMRFQQSGHRAEHLTLSYAVAIIITVIIQTFTMLASKSHAVSL